MKPRLSILPALLMAFALTACSSFYQSVVTVTQVRNEAMAELAKLHAKGLLTSSVDKKIGDIDARYRESAQVAEQALIAYKAGGDQADYLKALNVTRAVVFELIDVLTPLLTPEKATTLSKQLTKASVP